MMRDAGLAEAMDSSHKDSKIQKLEIQNNVLREAVVLLLGTLYEHYPFPANYEGRENVYKMMERVRDI